MVVVGGVCVGGVGELLYTLRSGVVVWVGCVVVGWWWCVCGVVVGLCVGGVVAAATETRLMSVSECCSIQTHT